jgi:hypothetical protein
LGLAGIADVSNPSGSPDKFHRAFLSFISTSDILYG